MKCVRQMGFDYVFDESIGYSGYVSAARQMLLEKQSAAEKMSEDEKSEIFPMISTTCPVVVRLIQMKYRALISHLVTLDSPMELTAQYAIDHELVPENVVMESAHPYQKSGIWEYTHYEEAAALLVTFSSKTDVTGFHDMDSLYVTDANGREMQYKGTKLAGETLLLAGNTFTVYLKEVWSTKNEFGFRIISVTGLSQEEYEARLAEIEQNPWVSHVVNGTLEITGYKGTGTEIIIPAHINGAPVSGIADNAFEGYVPLTRVEIEDGVRRIGESAFSGCGNVTEIILPDSIEEIGSYAFYRCGSLESLDFPENPWPQLPLHSRSSGP